MMRIIKNEGKMQNSNQILLEIHAEARKQAIAELEIELEREKNWSALKRLEKLKKIEVGELENEN